MVFFYNLLLIHQPFIVRYEFENANVNIFFKFWKLIDLMLNKYVDLALYGYSIYTIADRLSYEWSYQIYFTLFVVVVVNCENNYRRNGSFVLKDHQRFLKKKNRLLFVQKF